MKKSLLAALVLASIGQIAHAQSSVTLYGILDAGIDFANNQGGASSTQAVSGIIQGSRWGVTGAEDLGGGTKAIFRLENGFDIMRGTLLQGGRMFGRAAYVGLTNPVYGTITIGRQNDFVADYLGPLVSVGQWGILFPHAGDVDNTGIDFRISNSVKYQSISYSGLQFGGLFGFGNTAGDFQRNSVVTGGVKYDNGPVSFAVAYLRVKNPYTAVPEGVWTPANTVDGNYGIAAGTYQVFGAGGRYRFGKAAVALEYTNTQFKDLDPSVGAGIGGKVTFHVAEIDGSYQLTPALLLGGGYNYTFGKVAATGAQPRYHEVNAILDYLLSVHTDLYVMAVWQKAAGDARYANLAPVISASSTDSQFVTRIGIRHTF
ncbi:porin [Pandoraea cepalis]|uniref:Porin n=1 Tax=Pandoraea cepalis TaxID=2508294 RepID=A0A5E4VYD5_9BURK|nr:porin [Pandoraea cepalis]VVE16559.1 porin [Pandoraea cepalis]